MFLCIFIFCLIPLCHYSRLISLLKFILTVAKDYFRHYRLSICNRILQSLYVLLLLLSFPTVFLIFVVIPYSSITLNNERKVSVKFTPGSSFLHL